MATASTRRLATRAVDPPLPTEPPREVQVQIRNQRPGALLSPTKFRWAVVHGDRVDVGFAAFRWTARWYARVAARNLARAWPGEDYRLDPATGRRLPTNQQEDGHRAG